MKMSLKLRHGIVIVIFLNMTFVSCGRLNKVSLSAIDSLKAPLMVDVDISQLNQKIEEFIMDTISEKFARFVDTETRLQDIVKNPGKWLQDVVANSSIEICSCPPGKHGLPGIKGQIGEKGEKGEKGFVGDKGTRGSGGNQGDKGLAGSKGERGDRGIKGEKGIRGDDGKDGSPGEKGIKGEVGEKGPPGDKGGEVVVANKGSNEKKTFKSLLLFTKNYLGADNLQIFITSTSNKEGNCNVTSPDRQRPGMIKITSNSTSTYSVDKSMTLTTGYSGKGIVVECDVPVSVFGFSSIKLSSDGFAVLPTSMIGQEYIVPAYMPHPSHFSLFGMTTLKNDTRITILTKSKGGKVKFDNRFYDDNSRFTITLDALQAAQVECHHCDLSGTSILSSAPIAVVAGADCANIFSMGCSHISEMVLPTSAYSYLFIIPKLPNGYRGKVRMFTNKQTSVSIHLLETKTQNISSNEFAEISYNEVHSVASTSPVMVQLYGNTISGEADAFMVTIPGINHYKNRYTFTVPDFNFNSSLSFIIPSENKDGIRLDGKPVDITGEREVVLQNISYTSFSLDVTPGFHMAEHIKKDSFGLFIVGFERDDGYGFIAGI